MPSKGIGRDLFKGCLCRRATNLNILINERLNNHWINLTASCIQQGKYGSFIFDDAIGFLNCQKPKYRVCTLRQLSPLLRYLPLGIAVIDMCGILVNKLSHS